MSEISHVLRPDDGKLIVFEVARNGVAWFIAKFLKTINIIPSDDFRKSVLKGYTQEELAGLLRESNALPIVQEV